MCYYIQTLIFQHIATETPGNEKEALAQKMWGLGHERRRLVELMERRGKGEPLTDEDAVLIHDLEERYNYSPAQAVLAIVDGVFSDLENGQMSVEDARKHVTGAIGDIAPLLDVITEKPDK